MQQLDTESIEDFYQRCIQSQYLVSDDIRDAAFEREVLLHFLIGLTPFIRDTVSNSLSSQASAPAPQPAPAAPRRVPVPAPAPVPAASGVEGVFGVGGANNVRVESPDFKFAYDF